VKLRAGELTHGHVSIPQIPETESSSLGLENTFAKKSSGSGSLSTNIHLPYKVGGAFLFIFSMVVV